MQLTGELKDKVDKAETKEEKKNILAEAGMELTDEELENVIGGACSAYFKCRGCGKELIGDCKMDGSAGSVFCNCGCTYLITRDAVIHDNSPLPGYAAKVLTDVTWRSWW